MPRFVRFPGLLLTAILVVAGCTSSPPTPAASARSATAATSAASTSDASTPSPAESPSVSPSATPTRSAKPSVSATPTVTPTATTSKPAVTHTATATATPTASKTPTKAPTVSPDPIIAGAYAFPVAGCHVSYSAYHHDYPAADIFAARGCHFVASTSGTIDEVGYTDSWRSSANDGATRGGLYVSLVGDDGVRYYGSHLSAIAAGIAPGAHVNVGDLLGLVGDSGDARGVGTHVHYGFSWPTGPGIWWVRRGWISPYKYLTSWQAGVGRSPSSAIAAAHAAAGDTPRCRVDC